MKKKTKVLLIVGVSLAVLLLLVVILFLPALIQPVLWSLLVLGLGFFALELWSRRKKKAKQKDFDEKLAAREGIEDRKREWSGWVEELDSQGIDRYELPFYMIVGEPQSGKSVLLQNSDLYFPFGQERLSGVGGTRGCDWWFTDEAVILDIAGRLFTHEGGVADRLEWEAFLEQLNDFRPMCPANGVLLVIPCDALLEDSPEVCTEKANRIQSALMTLMQKLQAQLPVYLVLTKGDRVFGFAESVHRLDAEQRHQMFGWSRASDKAEKPFSLDEAREGFLQMVEQARSLREKMVASARLPEALPEVDRLYAFPDELAALLPSLEIYLKRIFSESNLVERSSFRGIYLTSGLQTGAPVAKVCAELLGTKGESDARALEGLFSHQRAYFIKDLVRKRVFAERGLVRPTEGRVLAARRNAKIGYGAAAVLAAVSVVGAIFHVATGREDDVSAMFERATTAAKGAILADSPVAVLKGLHALDMASRVDEGVMHEVFLSTRDGFRELYARICAEVLAPKLRIALETKLREELKGEPTDNTEFMNLVAAAAALTKPVDFSEESAQTMVARWLPECAATVKDHRGQTVTFSASDAFQRRVGGDKPVSDPVKGSQLDFLVRDVLQRMDEMLDPATPWMPRGHLGYMLAWKGAKDAFEKLEGARKSGTEELLTLCDRFANSVKVLRALLGPLAKGVTNREYIVERRRYYEPWLTLSAWGKTDEEAAKAEWDALGILDDFSKPQFDANPGRDPVPLASPFGGLLGRWANRFQTDLMGSVLAEIPVGQGDVGRWTKEGNEDYVSCSLAPHARWNLRALERDFTGRELPKTLLFHAKMKILAVQWKGRIPSWAAARTDYHKASGAPAPGKLDRDLLSALIRIHATFTEFRQDQTDGGLHLANLIEGHLAEVERDWASRTPDPGASVDWDLANVLAGIAAQENLSNAVQSRAQQLYWLHVGPAEKRLLLDWSEVEPGPEDTIRLVGSLNEHLEKLEKCVANRGAGAAALLDDTVHNRWIEQVDALIATRLDTHIEVLRKHWQPDTREWVDLASTLRGVKKALGSQVAEVIAAARRSRENDAASAQQLRGKSPVLASNRFPRTKAKMIALRSYRLPTAIEITNHKLAKALRTQVESLEQRMQRGARDLVSEALAMRTEPSKPEELTTSYHYLLPLREILATRVIQEVRNAYLAELSGALLRHGPGLLDALYAKDVQSAEGIEDPKVRNQLGQLLDPEGALDQLRKDFKMIVDTKNRAGDLHPGEGEAIADEQERLWWEFEEFLVGLQTFLTDDSQNRVALASFQVQFAIPEPAAGVWDSDLKFVYFASTSKPGDTGLFASKGNEGWGTLKPSTWTFQSKKRPQLWFVWTNKLTQRFTYPDSKQNKADVWIEWPGSLAPLQLAWTGTVSKDGLWWQVSPTTQPDDSNATAPLRILFRSLQGKDRKLPVRPARKPRKR